MCLHEASESHNQAKADGIMVGSSRRHAHKPSFHKLIFSPVFGQPRQVCCDQKRAWLDHSLWVLHGDTSVSGLCLVWHVLLSLSISYPLIC